MIRSRVKGEKGNGIGGIICLVVVVVSVVWLWSLAIQGKFIIANKGNYFYIHLLLVLIYSSITLKKHFQLQVIII